MQDANTEQLHTNGKKKREIGKKYTVKCDTFKKINKFMLTADVHYMQFAKTDNYFSHER